MIHTILTWMLGVTLVILVVAILMSYNEYLRDFRKSSIIKMLISIFKK